MTILGVSLAVSKKFFKLCAWIKLIFLSIINILFYIIYIKDGCGATWYHSVPLRCLLMNYTIIKVVSNSVIIVATDLSQMLGVLYLFEKAISLREKVVQS